MSLDSFPRSVAQMIRVMRKPACNIFEQQRRRSACALAHSYQRLHCSPFDAFMPSEIKISRVQPTSSRKHLRTKVTPDFHLRYSKNGGNLGIKMIKKIVFNIGIKSYVVDLC